MAQTDSHDDPTADRMAARVVARRQEDAVQDVALVGAMAAGDESALGALYDRWVDAVTSLVVRIVRDARDAEEVVEAVFWQAWLQAGRYAAERGTPGAWLLAMARSRSLDRVRTVQRRREDAATDDTIFEKIPATGDPLSHLDARERAARVMEALGTLPDEQREVLELAYFEGLSQTEIADRLAQPLGTVKTRARLGLRKLRERLDVLREVDA